jgi:predicted naringenin-chalcone synthase
MATGFVRNGDAVVDLVHTEMCSLHMNATLHTPEQMVVQSLFADGYMKYSATPKENAEEGFEVITTLERIIPNTTKDMTWVTADWGMHMTLSREVPDQIGNSLGRFVQDLCERAQVSFEDMRSQALFAVHPGGPRIIDSVQAMLQLSEEQVADSKGVLLDYGNMSSATLPHVWQRMLSKKAASPWVLSLAFGPGLTMFGAVFKRI